MTDQPTHVEDQSFWDEIDRVADAADVRRPRLQYGKLTIKPGRYIHWVDKSPVDVTSQQYATLSARDKSLELLFSVDIQELSPELEFTYERRLRPGEKDWHKILKPSISALLGKDSMSKGNYSATLQSLNGKYVEVDDFPQSNNDEYNTIKLLRIFETKEECAAAHKLAFAPTDESGSPVATLSTPDGWEASAWLDTKPHIEAALTAGQTPAQIAADYDVAVPNIVEIKSQM